MIKHATIDIEIIKKLFNLESKEFIESIENLQPSEEDLSGAVEGLLRLQTVYRLKSKDFANGFIDGQKTRPELTAHELFVIGSEAFKLPDQDYFVKEYLHLSFLKNFDKEVDENLLMTYLIKSYNRTGDYTKAIEITDELIQKNPKSEEFKILKRVLSEDFENRGINKINEKNPFSDFYVKSGEYSQWKEEIVYSQICRGNVTQSLQQQSKLHCFYKSSNSFTKVARFKVEEVNLKPYIILFIDVISEEEINFLKNSSKLKSQRSAIFSSSMNKIKSNYRTSKHSFHNDDDNQIFKILSRRVEVICQKYFENLNFNAF